MRRHICTTLIVQSVQVLISRKCYDILDILSQQAHSHLVVLISF
jgi:hypothetical protein